MSMRPRKLALALSLCALCNTPLAQAADELERWLKQHAVPVRSIDAADENFSDLEPLIDAIGAAPVVQLGEPSHGAGGSFAAKVRLIKFLHQRMGFDVLVWESGMHGMQVAQASLRAKDDAVVGAQKGIFTIWSNTEQVKPLLEYVQATQSSTRPLEMAGFDQQFTARGAFEAFAADMRAFVSKLHDPQVRERSQELVERALASYERCARNEPQALDPLNAATDALLRLMSEHRVAFEQIHGAREISFMEHALENMRVMGAAKADIDPNSKSTVTASFRNMTTYFNRRETQNARNLRWLIETAHAGRKIIVWAHNVHLINAYFEPEFRAIQMEGRGDLMKPTGVFTAEWLGDKVYTIGFTAHHGRDGWATGDVVTTLPPVSSDSLEARLHSLDKPYLFLDLRAMPTGHAQTMRITVPVPGHSPPPHQGNIPVPDITKAFDAIFYVDEMTPATRIGAR